MIRYMENFDFVRVISNGNEVLLFNECNLNSAVISKEVFDIIHEIKDISDYDRIAGEFCEEDRDFFDELRKVFVDKHLLEKTGVGVSGLKRINYVITDYCNLFCRHCCFSAKVLPPHSGDYSIKKELDILDRIISLNPETLNITGGEPLTISNFDEVLVRVKESGIKHRTLQTNATLINEDNVKGLTEVFNGFDISLDGSTPEETEKIRGKGVFEKVMNAIDLLKKNGMKNISVSCAMNLNETDKRTRFEELCKTLEVRPLVRQMSSAGRAGVNGLDTRDRTEEYFYDKEGEYCTCSAGRSEITVNSKGEVFPCPNFLESRFSMGNITDEDIESKLGWDKKHDWYKEFSQFVPTGRDECSECEVNILCWNCPFQIKQFMELHDIKKLTEMCERKKQSIFRRLWGNEAEILD